MSKAQVTIFVIIGIIIVVVAGVLIYLNLKKAAPATPGITVNDKLKPLQQFIDSCIEQTAQDAIIKIGQHGGYIDPSDPFLSGRLFTNDPNKQYESDMAYINPSDLDTSVAYWYYSSSTRSCQNCIMMSQAPYIDEMERQVSLYVTKNFDECVNNFTTFKDRGYLIEHADIALASTTLRDNDVLVDVVYPLNLTSGNEKLSMTDYQISVDIPLKRYYLMALNITRTEYSAGFLEQLDTLWIDSFSGLDSNKLPPTYEQTDGYTIVFWSGPSVKKDFEGIITNYIPMLQVPNTRHYVDITSKNMTQFDKNMYKTMTLDFFNGENLKNTDINFMYLGQDIKVKVNPSRGELITPNLDIFDSSSNIPPKRVTSYNFFYDITYPVIVEINDEYKPNNHFSFIFALQSNLKQNLALNQWWNDSENRIYWDPKYLQLSVLDARSGTSLAQGSINYSYKQRSNKNIFCEDSQRLSGSIILKTYDSLTQNPLDGATITYGCGNYASCTLGATKLNTTAGTSSFTSQYPICNNGYVSIEKAGYFAKKIALTTNYNIDDNLGSIYLDPIIFKNVTVKKIGVVRQTRTISAGPLNTEITLGYTIANNSANIGRNDTVIITFDRINDTLEDVYSQSIIIGQGGSNQSEVRLVPGRYTIKAQLIDNLGVVVPKECKEQCVNKNILGMCTETKKIPDKDIPIVPAVWGGVEFTENNPYIITGYSLESNQSLEVDVLRMPDPRCIDDIQEPGLIPVITQKYRQILIPRFIG